MKRTVILILISVFIVNTSFAQRGKKDKLENPADSVSYALEVSIATSIRKLNIPDLSLEKIYLAIAEVMQGEETKLNLEESQR